MWLQKRVKLNPKKRGFHVVTQEIIEQVPELHQIRIGLAHFFLQHTSASLSLNENADPSVRRDMEAHMNQLAPEHARHYTHTLEGADDMPAHLKAGLLGTGLCVPVADGKLLLGTWQGLYLGEHRNHGGERSVVVTIVGES